MKHLVRHIHKEVWQSNIFDYLLIFTVAVFFVLAMRLFVSLRGMQLFLIVGFAVFYICWGIYHHIITKTLRLKIMLEYVLIGFAIVFLALTLVNY